MTSSVNSYSSNIYLSRNIADGKNYSHLQRARVHPILFATVSNFAPYNYEVPADSGCFCGIAISLLSIIAKQFNYRLQLQAPVYESNRVTVENTTYDGPPADVLSGRVAISVAPLFASAERMRHFDLIHSFLIRDYQLAVHSRYLVATGGVSEPLLSGFINSFTYGSWLGIILSSLVVSSTMWAIQSTSNCIATGKTFSVAFRYSRMRMRMMSWDLFASFFNQGEVRPPKYLQSSYFVTLFWTIFCLVVSSVMVARLNASLTSSIQSPPFASVKQFLKSEFRPMVNRATSLIMNTAELKLAANKTILYTASNSARDLMRYASNVSQVDKISIICAMDEIPDCQNASFVRAARIGVFSFVSTFQLKKHSALYKPLSMTMLRMFQQGIIQREAAVHKTITYNAQHVRERTNRWQSHAIPVGIPAVRSVLYFLLVGCCLSLSAFVVELSRRKLVVILSV